MSSMSPVGLGTSPSIIEQALPSPITPMTPAVSWASPGDEEEDPLERFVNSPGVGTNRRSSAVSNTPPAGVRTPLRPSTRVPMQGDVARVGATAFRTRGHPWTSYDTDGTRLFDRCSTRETCRRSSQETQARASSKHALHPQ